MMNHSQRMKMDVKGNDDYDGVFDSVFVIYDGFVHNLLVILNIFT